jgi:hypothetical protein
VAASGSKGQIATWPTTARNVEGVSEPSVHDVPASRTRWARRCQWTLHGQAMHTPTRVAWSCSVAVGCMGRPVDQ